MHVKKVIEIGGHSAAVYSLAFDGEFLYSASADKYVTRWDITSGKQDNFAIQFPHSVYSICVTADTNMLVAGLSNGDLYFFDLKEKKELNYFQQHREAIFTICFDPALNRYYVADAAGILSVWTLAERKLLAIFPLNAGKIRRIAVSSNTNEIYLTCQSGELIVLDALTFNEMNAIHLHQGGCTALCLGNNEIISGGKDALLKKSDAQLNQLKSIPAHNYVIYDIIPINDYYVTASRDKSIKIWSRDLDFLEKIDLKSGGHKHSVNALVKINEELFASASDDGKIILWKINDSSVY